MKKWLIAFLVLIALALAGVYIFIPNIVKLRATVNVKATRAGLNRMLLDKNNVAGWWPGKVSKDSFYLHDFSYTIHNSNITVSPITITGKDNIINSSLFFVPITTDYTQLEWGAAMATSYSPVKRITEYWKAKKIQSDMDMLLLKIAAFYSVSENIYGFDIKKELVVDSILIQTSGTCTGKPDNEFIYTLVEKLRSYAISRSANVTGYPMLNIRPLDSNIVEVKVAIPLDKPLPGAGDILQKRMLGRGDILVTEVKGGNNIAAKAYTQIKKYAEDYQRLAPAIPFYSLITNRLQEPDSTKWVTKIYFPVM